MDKESVRMDYPTNMPRDHPSNGKRLYTIVPQVDGTMDVYLLCPLCTTSACREQSITVRLIRGVVPWDGLEEDIRARYDAWCESGEVILL